MRMRITGFLAAVLMLTGCMNTIEYDFGGDEPLLMVSGLLCDSDPVHTVYVSLSRDGIARPAETAGVTCYVNGAVAGRGTATLSDLPKKEAGSGMTPGRYEPLAVSFGAAFGPGDEVYMEFEAEGGRYKASSARLTVPGRPAIASLDTMRVSFPYKQDPTLSLGFMQVLLTVRRGADAPGGYCLFGRDAGQASAFFTRGGAPDFVTAGENTLQMWDEASAQYGHPSSSDGPALFERADDGSFAIFGDGSFRDGAADLKLYLSEVYPANLWTLTDAMREGGYAGRIDEVPEIRLERRVVFRLGRCSEETYQYLRVLRAVSSSDYIPEVMERYRIPSNIGGGTGFVDILSVVEAGFDFPDIVIVYPSSGGSL